METDENFLRLSEKLLPSQTALSFGHDCRPIAEGSGLPTSIDLFCGAGGITEGFRQAGFKCLYGNDSNENAMETFRYNHPRAWGDCRSIETVDARQVRRKLGLRRGELSTITGGPPCQGFSINAPERFLEDPRNALFRHYVRFIEEFETADSALRERSWPASDNT
jgi:site-specific DNA-cytosine methylase